MLSLMLQKLRRYAAFFNGGGYIYIMTNKNRTTLFVGVTSDLLSRVVNINNQFFSRKLCDKYNHDICIYYEYHSTIYKANARIKQIKEWRRDKKVELVNSINPA